MEEEKIIESEENPNNDVISIDERKEPRLPSVPDDLQQLSSKVTDALSSSSITSEELYALLQGDDTVATKYSEVLQPILEQLKEEASIKDYMQNHVLKLSAIQAINRVVNTTVDNLDVIEALKPVMSDLVTLIIDWTPSDAAREEFKEDMSNIESNFESNDATIGQTAVDTLQALGIVVRDLASSKGEQFIELATNAFQAISGVRPEWIEKGAITITNNVVQAVLTSVLGINIKDGTIVMGKEQHSTASDEFLAFLIANILGQENWTSLVGGLAAAAPAINSTLTFGLSLNTLAMTILDYAQLAAGSLTGNWNSVSQQLVFNKSGSPGFLINLGPMSAFIAINAATFPPVQFQFTPGLPVVAKQAGRKLVDILKNIFNFIPATLVNSAAGLYNTVRWQTAAAEFKREVEQNESALERYIKQVVPQQAVSAIVEVAKYTLYELIDYIILNGASKAYELLTANRESVPAEDELADEAKLDNERLDTTLEGIVNVDSVNSTPINSKDISLATGIAGVSDSADKRKRLQAQSTSNHTRFPAGFLFPGFAGGEENQGYGDLF